MFGSDILEQPGGKKTQQEVTSYTNIVVSGVLHGRGDQHQHQRHDGGIPGERGNFWNQLREKNGWLFFQ